MLSDEEMEDLAVRSFEENKGKLVLAGYADVGYRLVDGEEGYEFFEFDTPILCRIVDTNKRAVVRWSDPRHIDPYWNAEIVGEYKDPRFEIQYIVLSGHEVTREGIRPSTEWYAANTTVPNEYSVPLGYY